MEPTPPAWNSLLSLAAIHPRPEDVASLHAGLALEALSKLDGPVTPDKLRRIIAHEFGVKLTLEAMVRTLGALFDQDKVAQHVDQKVFLVNSVRDELIAAGKELRQRYEKVVEEWLDELDARRRDLQALDRLHLTEDLELFLLGLVRYHGAEFAALLFPRDDVVRSLILEDTKHIFADLPERPEPLAELRRLEFPAFIREASTERASYISSIFHRATLLQVLQIDATAVPLFTRHMAPKILYLDTNVVFRILGLQGRELQDATRELISVGVALGHRYLISSRTYAELSRLVVAQINWINQGAEIPEALAGVAADMIAGNDYVSSFWAARARTGITAASFGARFGNLRLLLEDAGIEVGDEGEQDLEKAPAFKTAVFDLKIFKPHDSPQVVEHDAFHKVLIERLRERQGGGVEPGGWLDASHLFLTFDNQLPRLAAYAAKGGRGHRVPFCAMAAEWLQVLYFVKPEFQLQPSVFIKLLNSPYLQEYFAARSYDRDLVRDAVTMLAEFKEYRPEVARRILIDRLLMTAVSAASDPSEKRRLMKDALRSSQAAHESEIEREKSRLAEEIRGMEAEAERREAEHHAELQAEKQAKERQGIELRRLREQVRDLEQASVDSRSAAPLANDRGQRSLHASKHWSWLIPAVVVLLIMAFVRVATAGPADPVAWSLLIVALIPALVSLADIPTLRTVMAVLVDLIALVAFIVTLIPGGGEFVAAWLRGLASQFSP